MELGLPRPIEADVIANFWELRVNERHGHRLFKGLTESDDFGDLKKRLDCLHRAINMRKSIAGHGGKRRAYTLPPNIVLMLAFNQYTTRNAGCAGLFVHLWTGVEMRNPIYFLCREWSTAEREAYDQSSPADQIRIAHMCLPWHVSAPDMPTVGVTLLMPDRPDNIHAEVLQFRLPASVSHPKLVVLLWACGKLLFSTMSELTQLPPPPDGLASGGPFYARVKEVHLWNLPLHDDQCHNWINKREMRGEMLEAEIGQRLEAKIWTTEGDLAEEISLVLPRFI